MGKVSKLTDRHVELFMAILDEISNSPANFGDGPVYKLKARAYFLQKMSEIAKVSKKTIQNREKVYNLEQRV